MLAIEADVDAAERQLAVPVGMERDVGRPDEVEVLLVPEIGFDDPPGSDAGSDR